MSLFKRKESSFDDMDSRDQLKRISEQLGFLEKKVDTLMEELRSRGGSRPSFGGGQGGPRPFNRDRQDRGGFRGGNGGRPRPEGNGGGNTRYAGQGPRRYSPGRPYGGGNDENRGNFSGGGRPEGMRGNHRPNHNRRPHQQHNAAPSAPPAAASQEAQPE